MKAFALRALAFLASGVFWLIAASLLGAYFITAGINILFGTGPAFIAIGIFFFLLALFFHKGLTNGS